MLRSPQAREAVERERVVEALLDRLREADPITGVPGSLTADLAAAREICEVVEELIEGRQPGGLAIVRRMAVPPVTW